MQGQITGEEVSKAINNMRREKARGMDEVPAEMLKHGGDAVVEWMLLIYKLSLEQGRVLED